MTVTTKVKISVFTFCIWVAIVAAGTVIKIYEGKNLNSLNVKSPQSCIYCCAAGAKLIISGLIAASAGLVTFAHVTARALLPYSLLQRTRECGTVTWRVHVGAVDKPVLTLTRGARVSSESSDDHLSMCHGGCLVIKRTARLWRDIIIVLLAGWSL